MKVSIELDERQILQACVDYVNARAPVPFSVWDIQVQNEHQRRGADSTWHAISRRRRGAIRLVGSKLVP